MMVRTLRVICGESLDNPGVCRRKKWDYLGASWHSTMTRLMEEFAVTCRRPVGQDRALSASKILIVPMTRDLCLGA